MRLTPFAIACILICGVVIPTRISFAEQPPVALTVAEAKQQAQQIGNKTISITGHVFFGKEGAMVYDSYYKATLGLNFSEKYSADHRQDNSFNPLAGHKSNRATLTGHFGHDQHGNLILIVDGISAEK